VDGTRKASYDAVRAAIADARARGCTGTPVRWTPSSAVAGPKVSFGALGRGAPTVRVRVEEQADYTAAIFRAEAGKSAIARQLASRSGGGSGAVASTRGTLRAYYDRLVRTPAKLEPGSYVYALRLTAWANPDRKSVFVSAPFRVGSVWEVQ
jgi:hypothetical protein